MIKGIIFDQDGVLIDSSPIHYENWNGIFKKHFGVTIPKNEFSMQFGKSMKHFSEYFIDKYKIDISYKELKKLIVENFDRLMYKIQLKKGIDKVLPKLKKDYKLAVATGGSRSGTLIVLKQLEILDYFDYIICGDEVNEAKPHPEIFLSAAKNIGLKPEECIVIEDAILGIKAAKKAGMKVIAVDDEFTNHQDHSSADDHIKYMTELNKKLIERL